MFMCEFLTKEKMTLKRFLDTVIPPFTRIPLIAAFLVNLFAYYGTKLLTLNATHHDLTLGLDSIIPFIPFFVSFYVLAYGQWAFSYLFHTRQSEKTCYYLMSAIIYAKLISSLFFIFFPTQTVLPTVNDDSFWGSLTKLIYSVDTPRTLFPSLHCLESWFCFRGAMHVKNAPKWYIVAQGIFALLVFGSTVHIKQHFFVDIFAGIAVAELGLFLAKKKDFSALFQKAYSYFTKTT